MTAIAWAARPRRTPLYMVYMAALAALALMAGPADEAHAIVKGASSSLGPYVVRIYAGYYCSGVAIARRAVVTAAHCVSRRMRIVAGSSSIAVAGISRSAVLDDGRHVQVAGDAAILRLARPLPGSVSPATVGQGEGDSYTIAGYGTATERHRAAFGSLREARLVAAGPHALVDPNRVGSIGASACFGDSGGPVLRGSTLIGVITRAAHPSPRIACGDLTRWAPIMPTGTATETTGIAATDGAKVETPRRSHRHRTAPKRTARRTHGDDEAR
jgi:hypothetical protein